MGTFEPRADEPTAAVSEPSQGRARGLDLQDRPRPLNIVSDPFQFKMPTFWFWVKAGIGFSMGALVGFSVGVVLYYAIFATLWVGLLAALGSARH